MNTISPLITDSIELYNEDFNISYKNILHQSADLITMDPDYGTLKTVDWDIPHDWELTEHIISGLLSLFYGIVILRVMIDRRLQNYDRRQRNVSIYIPDRRSGIDRRTR